MSTTDLERIRFVTGNLAHTQGLRMVILGAYLLAVLVSTALPLGPSLALLLAATVTALVTYRRADRWYARRYGRVRGSSVWDVGLRGTPTRVLVIGGALTVLAFLVETFVWTTSPVVLTGVVGGLWTVSIVWPARHYRPQWVAVNSAIVVLCAMPALVDLALRLTADGTLFEAKLGLLVTLIGSGAIVCGVIDEVQLRRELTTAQDDGARVDGAAS